MKRLLPLLLLLFSFSSHAQKLMQTKEKAFNWGIKAGGNSALPVVTSFLYNGEEVESGSVSNEVGYFAEIFGRVNVDRIFLQPSFVWNYSRGRIDFTYPVSAAEEQTNAAESLSFSMRSLEVPVFVGYHIVRESPYALSVMAGGKFRYNYKMKYTSEKKVFDFHGDDSDTMFSLLAGVSISVGRLFFDANYEFGLSEVTSDFTDVSASGGNLPLKLTKRQNAINISLGLLF